MSGNPSIELTIQGGVEYFSEAQLRELKPFKCTHCTKGFANQAYLLQHIRIHSGVKPYGPCQYCGRKFTQLSHLQQHIRTHTGERPYRCSAEGCTKSFSQLSNLHSHSRRHNSQKPFKCYQCYKCFSEEEKFLVHIKNHSNSNNSNKNSQRKRDIHQQQQKQQHPQKAHSCPHCPRSYNQQSGLSKHIKKCHPQHQKQHKQSPHSNRRSPSTTTAIPLQQQEQQQQPTFINNHPQNNQQLFLVDQSSPMAALTSLPNPHQHHPQQQLHHTQNQTQIFHHINPTTTTILTPHQQQQQQPSPPTTIQSDKLVPTTPTVLAPAGAPDNGSSIQQSNNFNLQSAFLHSTPNLIQTGTCGNPTTATTILNETLLNELLQHTDLTALLHSQQKQHQQSMNAVVQMTSINNNPDMKQQVHFHQYQPQLTVVDHPTNTTKTNGGVQPFADNNGKGLRRHETHPNISRNNSNNTHADPGTGVASNVLFRQRSGAQAPAPLTFTINNGPQQLFQHQISQQPDQITTQSTQHISSPIVNNNNNSNQSTPSIPQHPTPVLLQQPVVMQTPSSAPNPDDQHTINNSHQQLHSCTGSTLELDEDLCKEMDEFFDSPPPPPPPPASNDVSPTATTPTTIGTSCAGLTTNSAGTTPMMTLNYGNPSAATISSVPSHPSSTMMINLMNNQVLF